MSFGKYVVGWETNNDGEPVGSYYANSEKEAISDAKEEMRTAKIKVPSDAIWSAYKG